MNVNHDPQQCHQALLGASSCTIDTETTGIKRRSRIVSVGVRVDGTTFIFFLRSLMIAYPRHTVADLQLALSPLAKTGMTINFHNAPFDLEKLRMEGVTVGGRIRDSMRLLRLADTDRLGRLDYRNPPIWLNYRLKDVCRSRYGIDPPDVFGGSNKKAAELEYDEHTEYLASDLELTERLCEDLWAELPETTRDYYECMVAPLIGILLDMRHAGFLADIGMIHEEAERLKEHWWSIADEHQRRYGVRPPFNEAQLRHWLFHRLGLPKTPLKPGQKIDDKVPLDADAFKWLMRKVSEEEQKTGNTEKAAYRRGSLRLLTDYRKVASLLRNLKTPLKHVDHQTVRWHPTFDDRQASGRISSSLANLQAISKGTITVRGKSFTIRNMMVAPKGHVLVAVDVGQADIRVLASAAETWKHPTDKHRWWLNNRSPGRFQARKLLPNWRQLLKAHRNPHYVGGKQQTGPFFDPAMKKVLANAFYSETNRVPAKERITAEVRSGQKEWDHLAKQKSWDFYNEVSVKVFGVPKNDEEAKKNRKKAKVLALSTVNGKTPRGLAEDLFGDVKQSSITKARKLIDDFYDAFPDVDAFKALMTEQIARTGMVETFCARPRVAMAHRWMVTEPVVDIKVTYARSDQLWLRVMPLNASLRCLTCYVIHAQNADEKSPYFKNLIYHHQMPGVGGQQWGWLSTLPYRFYHPPQAMMYCLPIRNIAWRSIRAVRTRPDSAHHAGQSAFYPGFDKVARQLWNHIAQGGTADVVKLMMLEVNKPGGVCERYGARMILQIHDELVFEVPVMGRERWRSFISELRHDLRRQPPRFRVPIKIEVKMGRKFGEM